MPIRPGPLAAAKVAAGHTWRGSPGELGGLPAAGPLVRRGGKSLALAAQVPIERRADWLVMATRLVLLRSRLLFPATPEAAATAEREAAQELAPIDKLRFVRAATSWLQARPQLGHDVYSQLYNRGREILVRLAARHGVKLRQSYQRLAKRALRLANRYAHARQMRRARREIKRLKTFLGRVARDVGRKLADRPGLVPHFSEMLARVHRLLAQ